MKWPVNGSALPPPFAAAGMGGFEVLVRLVTAATHNSPCQSVRQHVPHQPAVKESLRVAGAAGKSPPPPLGAAPTSGFAGGGALGLQTKDETTQLQFPDCGRRAKFQEGLLSFEYVHRPL